MKNNTFILSSIIIIIFFFCTSLSIAENTKPTDFQHLCTKESFDEYNIVARIAVIADIHIQGPNGIPSKKLARALEQLKKISNNKLDVILVPGDLTDCGLPEQVSELKRVFDNSNIDYAKTRLVFALGNHEYYNHLLKGVKWNGGYLIKNVFGDDVYAGATEDEIKKANYHAVVKGYDFIAVNCVEYEGGVKYVDSDVKWLEKSLEKSALKHPGKPIFVASHPNITGTNFGSNEGAYWAGKDLYNVLKKYPQVIFFCGHLHFPENDERSIWQGDFTSIGVGSTYYCSNHPMDDDNGKTFIDTGGGYETSDALKTSQGLFVEIDKNNNVRIKRMDFENDEVIKKPWLIPAPQKDKSHLLHYTFDQEMKCFGKTPPVFPPGASVKELVKDIHQNNKYEIQFTQATDNDMVYSYQISFIDKNRGKIIKTISTLSDFYKHSDPEKMASTITKTIINADSVLSPFSLNYNSDYYIQIVAIDCFGLKSKPLVSEIITKGIALKKEDSKKMAAAGGSFIQNWLCCSWTDERWQKEFNAMKELGMQYLIIGPTVECTRDGIAQSIYPSNLTSGRTSIILNDQDLVDACLRNAEVAGIKVFLGIGLNERWWDGYSEDSEWFYKQMEFENKVCDELWQLYKGKYPNAFNGWYWVYEVANIVTLQEQQDALVRAMNIQLDHLSASGKKLPFMWCPYMNSKLGTPEEYQAMWEYVFSKLHTTDGDIFAPQDCVGAGGLKLNEVESWFSALRKAVDTKPGLELWSDVETFDHTDWTSATIDRFVSQMEMVEPYVENYVTFAYCHYYSPFNTVKGYQTTYLEYLRTGKLDSVSPSVPGGLSLVRNSNGEIILNWEPSEDNIGVCGYYIYRDGKLTYKVQASRIDDSENNITIHTTLTDKDVTTNTTYTYELQAYDFANNVSELTPPIEITPVIK